MGGDYSTESPRGNISIDITASKESHDASVRAQGSLDSPISGEDFKIFKLTYETLSNTVNKLHKSKSKLINDTHSLVGAYVKGPTPLIDMYTRYQWKPIKRTLKPIHTEVLNVTNELVVVANQKFTNRSNKLVTYNAGVSHEEENTVTLSWSANHELSLTLNIDHKIVFPGSGEISFKSSWGQETQKSKAVTIGVESGLSVELSPGEEIVANLRVTRSIMEVKVTYEARLQGDVACRFKDSWQWHHVKFDINDVLKAANLSNTIVSSEVIKIYFSTDGEILLSNG